MSILIRLTQFLNWCVSASLVKCLYNQNDEFEIVFLKICVSSSVAEFHRGGTATNKATPSSFNTNQTI